MLDIGARYVDTAAELDPTDNGPIVFLLFKMMHEFPKGQKSLAYSYHV